MMDKFLKKSSDVTHHQQCIIKEELIIADSDEEIDVETVDKEIYSNRTNPSFSVIPDAQTEIQSDKNNKSNGTLTSGKSGRLKNKNVSPDNKKDNKKQTTLDLFVQLENLESNNQPSKNSIDSTNNKEPKADVKFTECDIDTLAKKLTRAYCKKCRKESVVIRQIARCSKCKTQFSYVCHTCDKTYYTFFDLGYHLRTKHMEILPTHQCKLCDKTFTYRKGLLYHNRTQHNVYDSLKCSKCDKKFSRSANKALHERYCGRDKKMYNCDKCPYNVRHKASLIRHITEKHSEFKEKCKNCPKVFKNQRSLKKHIAMYCNKTKILECNYCGHKVSRKDQMIIHINKFHMIGYRTNFDGEKFRCTKTCQDCGLTLNPYERIKHHMKHCKSALKLKGSCTFRNAKTCQICGLTLARYERMRNHLISCKSTKSGLRLVSGPPEKESRICKYCGETLKPREYMRYHVERCESAPLALRYSAGKAKQPDMDTALKELAISYCAKCKFEEPLKDQVRRCSKCNKQLRFACVSCPNNFANSNFLREHIRQKHVRTLKFYRCDKCHCSYNCNEKLIEHKREIHSDKSPTTNYKCEKCDEEYESSGSLQNHMISCGQQPKFYCNKCPYKTHFKNNIVRHIWAKRATCI